MSSSFEERLYQFVDFALAEDVGDGDHTTLSTIDINQRGEAKLLVKDTGILAGVEVAKQMLKYIDPELEFFDGIGDGEHVEPNQIAFVIRGSIHTILKAERIVLNVMQRMSGIATTTMEYVSLLEGTKAKILDTRKTTPLIRFLEKEAVRIGGGENHRFGLYDMILIKDNHVDYAGGITAALSKANQYRRTLRKHLDIEIEVRNTDELDAAITFGQVERIMLDNFTPQQVADAVILVNGRFVLEASGGITKESIREYALTGVDFISVGALTHSVKSLDLSLKAKII